LENSKVLSLTTAHFHAGDNGGGEPKAVQELIHWKPGHDTFTEWLALKGYMICIAAFSVVLPICTTQDDILQIFYTVDQDVFHCGQVHVKLTSHTTLGSNTLLDTAF
jgi:hypothetical protein